MAQTIVLDQRQRQGTHTSASMLVPAGISTVTVLGDISAADLASTKSFRLIMEQSTDDGQTWHHRFGFGFQGPMTEQPFMRFAVGDMVGTRVRVTVDIPDQIRMGAIIDVV